MKMADVDIDPFGEHDKTDPQPNETDETISFTPGGVIEGGSTPEQETSFGGTSQRTEVLTEYIKALYHVLSENLGKTPEAHHFDDFELRNGELYYRDKSKSLTIRGEKLESFGATVEVLHKEGLCDLRFQHTRSS